MKFYKLFIFLMILSCGFALYFFFIGKGSNVVCTKLKVGTIRDTVSGNVQVLANKTYNIKSQIQGVVSFAAVSPLGKPIFVEQNQSIFQFEITDLNRSLKQALIAKEHLLQRIEKGSSIALQLEIEEEDLKSLTILYKSDKIPLVDLNRKRNLVNRLRTQFEHEKVSHNEAILNHNLNIESLESRINKMTIKSPIKGQLISSHAGNGDMIFPGHHLAVIISNDRLIEASLNEEDFSDIKEGLPAGVTLFSLGKIIYEANVSRISSTVNPSTGRRIAYLEIKDKSVPLPPGSSGRVEIIKSIREDRLLLPRKALIGNSVFIVKDGRAKIKDVKIGAQNLEMVEIKDGLNTDDIIVIETPHTLHDGERVKPVLIKNN